MVYTGDLKSPAERIVGSSPTARTNLRSIMTSNKILFLGTEEDRPYLYHLRPLFGTAEISVVLGQLDTLTKLELYCAAKGITNIVTTSPGILTRLVESIRESGEPANPSIDNYSGSFFSYQGRAGSGLCFSIVIIDPIKQLTTVPYSKFITARHISKLIRPQDWIEPTAFTFSILDTPTKIEAAYEDLSQAYAISVDIETRKHNLSIDCIGYCGIFIDNALCTITTRTYVLPLKDMHDVYWMRKLCDLPAQKILQNGKYDAIYLLRYNSPLRNWLWDTAVGMHCLYSELPKDLAYQNAFFLREVVYWKDLAESADRYTYYKYNAMDCWATANIWLVQRQTNPAYAEHNYFLEFPLLFPCILSELTGLVREQDRLESARAEIDSERENTYASLHKILGCPTFNANSYIQVRRLLKILTGKTWTESDAKVLESVAYKHPLNRVILSKIKKIKSLIKIKGTYLRTDDDIEYTKDGRPKAGSQGSKDYRGLILYSLSPSATDSGRLASGEHAFWCGANIQNILRGRTVKQTIKSYPGFLLAEADLKQAESWDTAFIVGSEPIIAAVSGDRDFHAVNASAFFGTSYIAIYDDRSRKTLNKALRDLAKRVNHGANYYMGANVLVDTMGEEKIWEAATLLGLKGLGSKEIAEELLRRFHRTYPQLEKVYYPYVLRSVTESRMLVSQVEHFVNGEWTSKYSGGELRDWTRYCFGSPDKNKRDLNSYVSHGPQSLNARNLNEAYMQVFYKIALPKADVFLLHAQIHDSILFSFREGHEFLAAEVQKLMEVPVRIKSCDGKIREFTVPADIKAGPEGKGVIYWSDTE